VAVEKSNLKPKFVQGRQSTSSLIDGPLSHTSLTVHAPQEQRPSFVLLFAPCWEGCLWLRVQELAAFTVTADVEHIGNNDELERPAR